MGVSIGSDKSIMARAHRVVDVLPKDESKVLAYSPERGWWIAVFRYPCYFDCDRDSIRRLAATEKLATQIITKDPVTHWTALPKDPS